MEAPQPSTPQTWKQRWRELRLARLAEANGGRNHLRRQFKRMAQAVVLAPVAVAQLQMLLCHKLGTSAACAGHPEAAEAQ